jgi:HD-GYP domain-containing protein (c-di-GMP phosphodiesterase class II)
MAVADVYDALTSRRFYKDAIQHEQAIAIIIDLGFFLVTNAGRSLSLDVSDEFCRQPEARPPLGPFKGHGPVARIYERIA